MRYEGERPLTHRSAFIDSRPGTDFFGTIGPRKCLECGIF